MVARTVLDHSGSPAEQPVLAIWSSSRAKHDGENSRRWNILWEGRCFSQPCQPWLLELSEVLRATDEFTMYCAV